MFQEVASPSSASDSFALPQQAEEEELGPHLPGGGGEGRQWASAGGGVTGAAATYRGAGKTS